MSPTSPTSLLLGTTLLASGLAASACSERLIEDGPIIYERREEICLVWCEMQMDPECGGEDVYETLDDCTEYCQSPDAPNWGLRENGEDECFDERRTRDLCIQQETCENRRLIFTTPVLYELDQDCADEIQTLFDCI